MAGQIISRDLFGLALSSLLPQSTTMVEIGVQRGVFSQLMLETWLENKRYVLIDAWASKTSRDYVDTANLYNQEMCYNETVWRMNKIQVSVMHIIN